MNINKAIRDIKDGEVILISDSIDREGETDIVIAAEKIKPKHIMKMRRDGGGLICVALHHELAINFNLPYMTDIYETASSNHEVLKFTVPDDIPYDERSSFSITINHRETYTGISDYDRALTIRELARLSAKSFNDNAVKEFGMKFRSPGHVPILRAADGLLSERMGHTELSIALMLMAEVTPISVVCEMLDNETEKALSRDKAMEYARDNDLTLIKEDEIIKEFHSREVSASDQDIQDEKWSEDD